MSSAEEVEDLVLLREAPEFLLREDHPAVGDDVELALLAWLDVGVDAGALANRGRETRGPFVIPASSRAILNADTHAPHSAGPRES
jgi:hypothetical protein